MSSKLAIIKPQNQVENGEIAAVLLDDFQSEATLKIVLKKKMSTELLPADKAYKSIVLKGKEQEKIRIAGKLIGIVRRKF